MKLISLSSIKIGEQLSFDLRGSTGTMLLRNKTVLMQNMVTRLKTLGFYAVYIDDDQYEDVEVRQAIPDEMKSSVLGSLQDLRPNLVRGRKDAVEPFKQMGQEILDEVRVSVLEPINMVSTFAIDNPMFLHAINTAIVTAAICVKSNVKPHLAENYVTAALIHDFCLRDIADDMADEFEHTTALYRLLKEAVTVDATCFMAAALHHEKFDGTGGPRRLSGTQIIEGARIIAVADLFDCVSFGYAGYPRLEAAQAVEYVSANAGTMLDPDIVKVFAESVSIYPTGATVKLDNGLTAMVYRQNAGMPTRPVLRIVSPNPEERIEIDMLTNMTVFIEKVEL